MGNECQALLEKLIAIHQPSSWDFLKHPLLLVLVSGFIIGLFFWFLDGRRLKRKEKENAIDYIMINTVKLSNLTFSNYRNTILLNRKRKSFARWTKKVDDYYQDRDYVKIIDKLEKNNQQRYEIPAFMVVLSKVRIHFGQKNYDRWMEISIFLARLAKETGNMDEDNFPSMERFKELEKDFADELHHEMYLLNIELNKGIWSRITTYCRGLLNRF